MKYRFMLIWAAFLLPSFSAAQQTITLNQAVNTALENNTVIQQLENNVQIQRYNIRNAEGDLFPSLNLSGNWNRTHSFSKGGTVIQNGIPINIGNQNNTNGSFGLTLNSNYTLFDGFANYERVELEEENETVLNYNLQQQTDVVVLQVNRTFFDVLKREQVIEINRENLAESQRQLQNIRDFFTAGRRTIADVYQQEVQVAQNELSVVQSENDLEKSEVDLLVAMNDDINKNINAEAQGINANITTVEMRNIITSAGTVNSLVSRALINRNDYKAIQQELKVNQIRHSIAEKVFYWPTVSAFGSYNINGDRIDLIGDNRVGQYGISINYPIFQGFNLDVSRQIAEVNIRQKSLESERLQKQIEGEIKKALVDLETTFKQVEILDRNIEIAVKNKEFAEENYRIGLGTLLEVQTASINLNNLRIDRSNAVYNFLLARRQLEYYTGDIK